MTPDDVAITPIMTGREGIISAVGDGVTVHDRNLRIVYQNQTMKDLFGDCEGRICYEAYQQRDKVCPGCPVITCFTTGEVHTLERQVTIGSEDYIFENCASPIRDDAGEIIAAVEIVRNATARKSAEEHIVRLKNLYEALSYTNKAIIRNRTPETLFREICHIAVEHGKFTLAIVAMLDETTGLLRPLAYTGAASRYAESLVVSTDEEKLEGQGPTGIAFRAGAPYICNDFAADPATTIWQAAALENGICASAAFPLQSNGKIIGAFKLYANQVGFFDQEIINLLLEMSGNVSFALDVFSREERRKEAEEALRKSEERLTLVLQGSNDGFWDWDVASGELSVSDHFAELLGYLPGEIAPNISAVLELVHPEDRSRMNSAMYEQLATQASAFDIEVRMANKSGDWRWFQYRGKVVGQGEKHRPLRVAGVASDISERKQIEENLRYVSTHDPLTGLLNRAYFETELLRQEHSRRCPVSILMADIDGLKKVNDCFGHTEGDRLIKLAAQVLQETFRDEDVITRIGGDEFAVILPDTDEAAASEAVKRVRRQQMIVSQTIENFDVCLSMGTATAEYGTSLKETMKLADTRMYYYKNRRKLKRASALLAD